MNKNCEIEQAEWRKYKGDWQRDPLLRFWFERVNSKRVLRKETETKP